MKLISSKRTIGELIEDLDLSPSEYIHRLYSWIEYALGIMTMPKYYALKAETIEISNHRATLPCDSKFIHSVWVKGGSDNQLQYVSASTSPLVGFNHNGYPISNTKISIDGYHIHSDVAKAKVLLIYKAIPKDCDGFPLVPNNPFVLEALMYYVIYRLALKGIPHPIINYETAYTQWERLYPRAANDVNWMTSSEYEEFTTLWNSPYLGSLSKELYIN